MLGKKKTTEPEVDPVLAQAGIDGLVGIDVANSTIKVWADGDQKVYYRNTVKEIKDAGLVYSFKTDYHMYVLDNQVFEVGDISVAGNGARGNSRYGSKSFRVEAAIGIAHVMKPGVRKRLRVVTGVPSALAKNAKVLEDVKKSLLGEYKIKSVLWEKVEEIEFEIVDVIVVPQPLGTMYSYLFDPTTGKLNEKLITQKALVVDIGWGTTDIAILESGRVRSTFGFETGTSDFISSIQEAVNAEIPEANIQALNPHELDTKLLESPNVETPFGIFDLSKFVAQAKEEQAEKIYSETMGLGLEFSKFYKIIFTGGGSLLYSQHLIEKFNDPRLIIQEDAVMSNAHGFYLLGRQ
ncbi:MAG: hypothetical protein ACI4PF_00650 [Christensenellales bacterium]